jgi:hypothetical protein
MEGFEKNEDRIENDSVFRDEIHSVAVRAGKRTYFFDVKSTKRNEFYLTVTESKKKFEQDGNFRFEKHKIFLYKEDFEKFKDGLQEAFSFINKNQQYYLDNQPDDESDENEYEGIGVSKDFTKLDFEDLKS